MGANNDTIKVENKDWGMDMKETVWGMIGCGDVTEKKSGPGLYKASGSRLKGVS